MDLLKDILIDLKRETPKKMILDTDTYNEIDDQFALAYAILSPERVRLSAVTAAPFLNSRSVSPKEGMLKSYDEILRVIQLTSPNANIPVYKGAEDYLTAPDIPQITDASNAIVKIVRESTERVYIVVIGCITNIASAILQAPDICEKAVVIWLGGHALHWQNTREFNMRQDLYASQIVFQSKIPLIQIPCWGMCSELHTTLPELEFYLRDKNPLCNYLLDEAKKYAEGHEYAWSKVLWDVAAVAVLVKPEGLDNVIIPKPILTNDCHYAFDFSNAPYIYTRKLNRDRIFGDLFRKLSGLKF